MPSAHGTTLIGVFMCAVFLLYFIYLDRYLCSSIVSFTGTSNKTSNSSVSSSEMLIHSGVQCLVFSV